MAKGTSLNLKTTLELMGRVDAARIEGQAAEAYVLFNRQAVKDQLRKVLESQGSHPDDMYLDTAIAAWEDAQNRFVQPSHTLQHTLAEWYANRWGIARRYGIPLVIVAASVGLALGSIKAANEISLRNQEIGVEAKVEALYLQGSELKAKVAQLQGTALALQLPQGELQTLSANLNSANALLGGVELFFAEATDNGVADDRVTKANFMAIDARAVEVGQQLQTAAGNLGTVTGIVHAQQTLTNGRRTLDNLLAEIRSAKPPEVLLTQAENLYQAGMSSINNRQTAQVVSYIGQLQGLRDDAAKVVGLNLRVETLYKAILAIAKEGKAIEKANALQAETQRYLQTADVGNMGQAVGQLGDLEQVLQQEYRLIITGGDTRCRDDPKYGKRENIGRCEKGLNPKNFYAFIDSVGTNGKLVPVNVRDEELEKSLTVTHWGERVPEAVYRAVERDFKDNGLIDKKELGVKQKGFLEPKLTYDSRSLERIGQITRKGN